MLTTSMSKILLNGLSSNPITHGRGLHHGDPLSLFLVILAIDPLYQLIHKAIDMGLLNKLGGRVARARISMYADDTVIFIKPTVTDIANTMQLLSLFGEATGLRTNL